MQKTNISMQFFAFSFSYLFASTALCTTQYCLRRRSRRRSRCRATQTFSLLFYASTHVYEYKSEKCTILFALNLSFHNLCHSI